MALKGKNYFESLADTFCKTPVHMEVLVRLKNNTSIVIDNALGKQIHQLETPRMIKVNYILEVFVLDLLEFQTFPENECTLNTDAWVLVIETLIKEKGFHIGLMREIWCLTKLEEFALALRLICLTRLRQWSNFSDIIKEFYNASKPNLEQQIEESSALDMLSQMLKHTKGKGPNVHDEVNAIKIYFQGNCYNFFSTFTSPFGEIPITEFGFNPFWIPMNYLKGTNIFSVVSPWMSSWFDWNDELVAQKVMIKGSNFKSDMLLLNMPFLDTDYTTLANNTIFRQMTKRLLAIGCFRRWTRLIIRLNDEFFQTVNPMTLCFQIS